VNYTNMVVDERVHAFSYLLLIQEYPKRSIENQRGGEALQTLNPRDRKVR
jgi:hypothetical protein